MTWFSRLFSGSEGTAQTLTAGQQQALATWQQLPAADWQRSHYRCRYVVVDVEATGSNVTSDRLRALAALSLVDGQIAFADAFQLALADAEQPADMPAAFPPLVGPSIDALIAFLQFVGKAPLVGYNVPFVARMIDQVLGERLGVRLEQPWIDLAWVLPDVFREAHEPQWRLDAWLACTLAWTASNVTMPFRMLSPPPNSCRSPLPTPRAKASRPRPVCMRA
jgi:DNA polymerase-3 subunit epsilon